MFKRPFNFLKRLFKFLKGLKILKILKILKGRCLAFKILRKF